MPYLLQKPRLTWPRSVEQRGLAARPGEMRMIGRHQRAEQRAEGLLAHAAMADRRTAEPLRPEPDRAALASAGENSVHPFFS